MKQMGGDVDAQYLVGKARFGDRDLPARQVDNTATGHRQFIKWVTANGATARVGMEAISEVSYEEASERLKKGLVRQPVPLMLLARPAVSVSQTMQGKGAGAGLLKDAMLRTMQAADIGGIRAMATHAKNDKARAFYEHFGFIASPTDPPSFFRSDKRPAAHDGKLIYPGRRWNQ